MKFFIRRSSMLVCIGLQRIESAAKLYDCEIVKFSIRETLRTPVESLSSRTFISRLFANESDRLPVLPDEGEPYTPCWK